MSTWEWTRQNEKQMAKFSKWLMVLLIPLFSLTITGCGDDDNDEPNSPDTPNTNTSGVKEESSSWGATMILTAKNGAVFQIRCYHKMYVGDGIFVGCYENCNNVTMAYIPNAKHLQDIREIPSSGWAERHDFKEGGYIVEASSSGVPSYMRLWVTATRSASGEFIGYTVKYQNM